MIRPAEGRDHCTATKLPKLALQSLCQEEMDPQKAETFPEQEERGVKYGEKDDQCTVREQETGELEFHNVQ